MQQYSIQEYEIDINLSFLYYSLSVLSGLAKYPEEIEEELNNLVTKLDRLVFKPIPSNSDILNQKLFIKNYLE